MFRAEYPMRYAHLICRSLSDDLFCSSPSTDGAVLSLSMAFEAELNAPRISRWRNFSRWVSSLSRRMYLWLLFVGLVAVLPALATWIIGYTHSNSPTMAELLADGDGFLIAIAISADAIGRVADRQRTMNIFSWFCAAVLCMALIAFVTTKTEIFNQKEMVEKYVEARNSGELVKTLETSPNDKSHIEFESKVLVYCGLMASFIIVAWNGDSEEGSE